MPKTSAPAKVEVFLIKSESHLGKYLKIFLLSWFFGSRKNGSDSEACALM